MIRNKKSFTQTKVQTEIKSPKNLFKKYSDEIAAVVLGLLLVGFVYLPVWNMEQPQAERKSQSRMVSSRIDERIRTHGNRSKKNIAITKEFIGKGNSTDIKFIESLTDSQVKATLFLTGEWIENNPERMNALMQNPLFEFGNLTYSYSSFYGLCLNLPRVDSDQKDYEIDHTQELYKVYGIQAVYFRFPGGCYTGEDIELVTDKGFQIVEWEAESISEAQNGSIVNITTVEDVKKLEEKYEPVFISEL